eukprot:TRINITY_DN4367_c0_g1_i2.p1 TRINITY_DN4367_c0_g1~~TRINITY_DN4367_c0_g1_i2.p1  ORF type:complete len:1016 (-),score=186.85 TRINITY_DN4367_c0_g1_i2:92-3139(-)
MEGVIRTSINYIATTDLSQQEYGLRVLINLTARNTLEGKLQIVIYKMLGPMAFIDLLQSPSEVVQMLTAWLLFHLTIQNDLIATAVLQSEIVQYLTPLLNSDTDDIVEKALWLLTNLSLVKDHSHLLGQFGITEILASHLSSFSPATLVCAAQPLRNLLHKDMCRDFVENQRVFCHHNGVKQIRDILSSTYPPPSMDVLLWLTSVLHVLSIHNPLIRRIIAATGVLHPLVLWLSSPSASDQVKEQILKILVNISLTPETEASFLVSHAVVPLVDLLLSTVSLSTKQLALSSLANITCNESIRASLRGSGIAVGLTELLFTASPGEEMEEAAVIVVANLAIDDFTRVELQEAGAELAVQRALFHRNVAIRDVAQTAVTNLSVPISDETRAILSAQGRRLIGEDDQVDEDVLIAPMLVPGYADNFDDHDYFHAKRKSMGPNARVKSVNYASPVISDKHGSNYDRNIPFTDKNISYSPHTTAPLLPSTIASPQPSSPTTSHNTINTSPVTQPATNNTVPLQNTHASNLSMSNLSIQSAPSSPKSSSWRQGSITNPVSTPHSHHTAPATISPRTQLSSSPLTKSTQPLNTSQTQDRPKDIVKENGSSITVNNVVPPQNAPTTPTVPEPAKTNNTTPPPPQTITPTPSPAGAPSKSTQVRRERILKEILDTESSYVKALGVCIKVYLNPLVVNPANPPHLLPELVPKVFLNIQLIFKSNCEFLKKLKSAMSKDGDPEIAEAFLWLWNKTSTAREYAYFITNFDSSRNLVAELSSATNQTSARFKAFLEKGQQQEQAKGMTLQSYLIQPIQRPPRYILLLNDLLKHTAEDHPHYKQLSEALERTKRVVDDLNESKRNSESVTKLTMLQSSLVGAPEGLLAHALPSTATPNNSHSVRQYIFDGTVLESAPQMDKMSGSVIGGKGSKYCTMFLFTDILLFTKQKKNKYKFKRVVPLNCLGVVDIPLNETGQNSFMLIWNTATITPQIKDSLQERGEVIINCSKSAEKEGWLTALKDAISQKKL